MLDGSSCTGAPVTEPASAVAATTRCLLLLLWVMPRRGYACDSAALLSRAIRQSTQSHPGTLAWRPMVTFDVPQCPLKMRPGLLT